MIKGKIRNFGRPKLALAKFGCLKEFFSSQHEVSLGNSELDDFYKILIHNNKVICVEKEKGSSSELLSTVFHNISSKNNCPKELYNSRFFYLDINKLLSKKNIEKLLERIVKFVSEQKRVIALNCCRSGRFLNIQLKIH